MVRESPGLYTINMSKAQRKGKIFIDYLRNDHNATAVAAYSTRARQGAPVATPITWEELAAGIQPRQFSVQTVPERLAKLKADPWTDFRKLRQSLTLKALRAVGIKA
jgi:bifunctional non-homologous end joining protein LigD